MFAYINKENEQNIKKFTYSGGTSSISYTYLWSPLAEKCVLLFPTWVAPNLITLIAFLILLSVHIVFMFLGDNSQGVPGWKCILMGISIFLYQTLDNVDGKQARRTKTSTPIGMLMDHGSDTINTFLIGIQMATILQITDPYFTIVSLYAFILIVLFCAFWIQYATGVFRLGRINGVDQGLPLYSLFCILAPLFKFDYLKQHHWYASYNVEIMSLLAIPYLFQLYSINKNIFKDKKKTTQQTLHPILLPLLTGVSLLALGFLGPTSIYERIYFHMIYILCFLWARNLILIQLSHVVQQNYSIYNIGFMFYLSSIAVFLVSCRFYNFNPVTYFKLVLIIQFCLLIEFLYSAFNQAADILNIKLFSIPDTEPEKKKKKSKY